MNWNRRKLRRFARWLVVAAMVLIVALALMPFWLPWVLRPTLRHFGLQFSDYERVSYSRFALNNVHGKWGNTTIDAKRIEGLQPVQWLLARNPSDTNRDAGFVISDAVLTVGASTNAPTGRSKIHSATAALDQLAQIVVRLKKQLPLSRISNSVVVIGKLRVRIATAQFSSGTLIANARLNEFTNFVHIRVHFENADEMEFAARGFDATLAGKFARDTNEWHLLGDATWLTNRADIAADFATNSWWPTLASIESPLIVVPTNLFAIPKYEALTASLAINVESNRFKISSRGAATPTTETNNLPGIEFSINAHGDPKSIVLDQFRAQSPWLRAELTNQIGLKRSGELIGDAAALRITADLSQLPGTNWSGTVGGIVTVTAQRENPTARFHLAAENVRGFDQNFARIEALGQFQRPILNIENLAIELPDGSTLQANGSANVMEREVRDLNWRVNGTSELTNQLAFLKGVMFEKIAASGSASGAITNLTHRGRIEIQNVETDALKPTRLAADWQATMFNFTAANLQVTAAQSALSLTGRFDFSQPHAVSAMLTNLVLRRTNAILYALEQSSEIQFLANQKTNWSLAIKRMALSGDGRELEFAGNVFWPSRGELATRARNVSATDFVDFLKREPPRVQVSQFDARASWTNGPIYSAITGAVSVADSRGGVVNADARLATGNKISIERVVIGSDYVPSFLVSGEIPVLIVPSATNGWFVADERRAIDLRVVPQSTNRTMSIALGSLVKIEVSEPDVRIQAAGTPAHPTASIALSATSVDWQNSTNAVRRPRIENMVLHAEVRPELIELRRFGVNVEGQPIVASGELEMFPAAWEKLWREKTMPDWSRAIGRLQITDAQIKSLSPYLPKALAPEGSLTVDVAIEPGRTLSGWLVLTNAATRPLGPFTPLRDIAARVRLQGSRATLEEFGGQIGGQPVRASGFVSLPAEGGLSYDVQLQSTNVPLARTVEFLLRGDLNVKFQGTGTNAPTLSGDVRLHDGLFVQYATDFVWSKPKRPAARPPYFSVTNEPFADWKLNLTVNGDRFLRVRSPIFTGVVSANLQLKNTLGDPLMTGDARADSGRVIFPFGTLKVERADATLNSANPHGPDLRVVASGRNFNYDIRLEVNGPADSANIEFSSTPPLTSEEILLMLTAGQIPQGNFSYSTQQRATRLATFFGKDLFSRFAGGGTGEDRLIITSGENISEEGKLTYSVEYKFTDRWSIVGEYDRFNAFNAHLKWKVLEK